LAVTSTTRLDVPDIPTTGEFVPGYEASQWYGVGVPKSTPTEVVEKLNKEINAGLKTGVGKHLTRARNRSIARGMLNARWQYCPSAHLSPPGAGNSAR